MMMMTMILAEWVVVLVCAGDDGEDDGDDDGDDNVDVDKCPSGRHQPPNPQTLQSEGPESTQNERQKSMASTNLSSLCLSLAPLLNGYGCGVRGVHRQVQVCILPFSHPEALHACPARTVARLCRRNCFCFYVCFPVNICSFSHYTV